MKTTTTAFKGLGQALRAVRVARRLTQTQVEKSLGWGPNRLSKYERGHSMPSLEVVGMILDTLGASAREWIDELERAQGKTPPPGVALPPLRPQLDADVAQEALAVSRAALERFERGTTRELALRATMELVEAELREEALRLLAARPSKEEP